MATKHLARRGAGGAAAGAAAGTSSTLRFCGCAQFRLRLVCATLASRTVRITRIREDCETPGLQQAEASFLRLLDRMTDGSKIEIRSIDKWQEIRDFILSKVEALREDDVQEVQAKPVGF